MRADDCFLLLVDLQVGSLATIRTIEPKVLKSHVIALATVANIHKMPAILTAGKKPGVSGAFLPELKALLPGHAYVERTAVGAFAASAVKEAAAATGRSTAIIAGVATDIGVLHTALGAKAAGLDVWVVVDACGTTDPRAETLAIARLNADGIGTTGWASLAAGWMGDFAGPFALETMALLSQTLQSGEGPFG